MKSPSFGIWTDPSGDLPRARVSRPAHSVSVAAPAIGRRRTKTIAQIKEGKRQKHALVLAGLPREKHCTICSSVHTISEVTTENMLQWLYKRHCDECRAAGRTESATHKHCMWCGFKIVRGSSQSNREWGAKKVCASCPKRRGH